MTTLLKRNLCDITGKVIMEDISNSDVFPDNVKINVMVDMNRPYYVMEGYAWIEEHYVTKWPWIIALLFFWCITPQRNKVVALYLKDKNGMCLDFTFPLDTSKNLKENVQSLPENSSYGVRDVWITTEEIIN